MYVNIIKGFWPWDANDKTTWKYVDHKVKVEGSKSMIKWIINPNFAYKHLDPNWDRDVKLASQWQPLVLKFKRKGIKKNAGKVDSKSNSKIA